MGSVPPPASITLPQAQPPPRGGMARNAFHLGLGQVATTALTVLLTAAVARTLGASDFGRLYLLTSIATFAYVFVDWGHGQYVTREIARHPGRSDDLIGSVLAVRIATAFFVCAPAVATAWLLGYDARTRVLTATMIAAWLPMYLALSYSWLFRGHERMDYDALINVTLKLVTLVLALVILALGGRLLAYILVFAVAGTMTLGLSIVLYRRLRLPPLRTSMQTARELIRGGAPMFTMNLAIAVQPYIDANMLYKFAPPDVVGWYGAAWNIAGTLVAPASILAQTAYPRLSRAANDETEFKRALHTVLRPLLMVAVLGAVGTYLFADLAVIIVYSRQKFGPAGRILQAFAPALLFIYIDMLLGYAIFAAGRAARLASAKFIAVLVTTGLEFVLIPWCQRHLGNGGIGLMFSVAAGELTMVVAALVLIPRGTVDGRLLADLARGLAAGGGTLLLMRSLPLTTTFIGIPLCVLTFVALSAAVGLLNRADAELLFAMLRRRRDDESVPGFPE
jgi:O-antigen/teichoic acid export membrane protein